MIFAIVICIFLQLLTSIDAQCVGNGNNEFTVSANETILFKIQGQNKTVQISNSKLIVDDVNVMEKIESLESRIIALENRFIVNGVNLTDLVTLLQNQFDPSWSQIGKFNGSTSIYPSTFSGFNDSIQWVQNCSLYDSWQGNFRMKLQMGEAIDYFRPLNETTTLCAMLKSNNLHQWASNVQGPWITPQYNAQFLGGAVAGYPASYPRSTISFWGSNNPAANYAGGCCAPGYVTSAVWGYGFTLHLTPNRI